jgi:hypothetical protein
MTPIVMLAHQRQQSAGIGRAGGDLFHG